MSLRRVCASSKDARLAAQLRSMKSCASLIRVEPKAVTTACAKLRFWLRQVRLAGRSPGHILDQNRSGPDNFHNRIAGPPHLVRAQVPTTAQLIYSSVVLN
jgi:hypothetical protein